MRSWLSRYRALPLRTRWLLTIVVYAVVITAIVIVVRSSGTSEENGSSGLSPAAEASASSEANHEGRVAIAEDEAPHDAKLAPGVSARVALERAVEVDARARIAHGELTGPLETVSCRLDGRGHARRRPLECTVQSAGLNYPFVGVADESRHELTWCKLDPPAEAGAPLEVPVSPRCRA
jgi:hypothetical protein